MYFTDCVISRVQVLAKPDSEPYKKSDGTLVQYYKLAIMQGRNAGMLDVSKEVYDSVEIGKFYDCYFSFNSDYDKIYLLIKKAIPSK